MIISRITSFYWRVHYAVRLNVSKVLYYALKTVEDEGINVCECVYCVCVKCLCDDMIYK